MTVFDFRAAVFQTMTLPRVVGECARFDVETLEAAARDVELTLLGSSREIDDGARPNDPERSHAAVALVRVLDEIAWAKAGATAGYYDADFLSSTSPMEGEFSVVNAINRLTQALAEFDEQMQEFFGVSGRVQSAGYPWNSDAAPNNFVSEVQEMREVTSSSEVREAVRLLVYASEVDWNAALLELNALVASLEGGITTLPNAALDTVSWALTGTELVFAYKGIDMRLDSLLLLPIKAAGARYTALTAARRELEDLSAQLTENETAIAIRRLEHAVVGLSSRESQPKDAGRNPPTRARTATSEQLRYRDLDR